MKQNQFYEQAELALRMLPFVNREKVFGLKGGTAINFFVRDFPRLSVDIDLTYLPLTDRKSALQDISSTLERISKQATSVTPNLFITPKRTRDGFVSALIIKNEKVQVKVEANLVIRSTLYPAEAMSLCATAKETFKISLKTRVLSIPDLYGGKICAALDRQHPRDLFDIKLLLENEGLTEEIKKAFIVYLISHPRPMAELLEPNLKDIEQPFENEFKGMTREPIEMASLVNALSELVQLIHTSLTDAERKFLLSVKSNKPEWSLLGIENVEKLPAVQWKIQNLLMMEKKKHQQAIEKLAQILQL